MFQEADTAFDSEISLYQSIIRLLSIRKDSPPPEKVDVDATLHIYFQKLQKCLRPSNQISDPDRQVHLSVSTCPDAQSDEDGGFESVAHCGDD